MCHWFTQMPAFRRLKMQFMDGVRKCLQGYQIHYESYTFKTAASDSFILRHVLGPLELR